MQHFISSSWYQVVSRWEIEGELEALAVAFFLLQQPTLQQVKAPNRRLHMEAEMKKGFN